MAPSQRREMPSDGAKRGWKGAKTGQGRAADAAGSGRQPRRDGAPPGRALPTQGRPAARGQSPRGAAAGTDAPRGAWKNGAAGAARDAVQRARTPPPGVKPPRGAKAERWGAVARHGADAVAEGNTASAEWRRAADLARRDTEHAHVAARRPPEWEPEVIRSEPVAARPGDRSRDRGGQVPRKIRKKRPLPADVVGELRDSVGARRAPRLEHDLGSAASAFTAGRYDEAERTLRHLARATPGSAAVRELHGLTLYRLGRWKPAKAELEAYRDLTGDVTQLPVLADCERALGHHDAVDVLWAQLREASPGVDVLSEGRLVAAGSLADRGRLDDAIGLLAPYEVSRARPKEWHLRTWYALADLYERAGDVPRARALFRRLVEREDEFFDAAERLAALR